tara:strand:- start:108 stop:563 length:456 start_codon:yes stop_codon:yes gene_type:complete
MDKKISALDAATALQGTELIPIVQSSTTKKTKVSDIVNYVAPYTLTIQAGTPIDLATSTYDDVEMIRLNWTGGNGTMVLTLPDATSTSSTNRVMRFISNGTLAAAKKVHITPSGSQTIDGVNAYYEVNKSYEGVTLWSDGIEWFIIQKKAS